MKEKYKKWWHYIGPNVQGLKQKKKSPESYSPSTISKKEAITLALDAQYVKFRITLNKTI